MSKTTSCTLEVIDDVSSLGCLSDHSVKIGTNNLSLVSMKRDDTMRLSVSFAESAAMPSSVLEFDKKNESYAVGLNFIPEITIDEEKESCASEIIFCIDRSGSMSGSRIKAVQNALQIFLRSLPEKSLFNIVSFGDKHVKMFPQSVKLTEDRFNKASASVSLMSGKTNTMLFKV